MPRIGAVAIYIFIGIFLTTGSMAVGAPAASKADSVAPKALFVKRNHHFGEVFEGTEIKHDFVVENKGTAPLVIKSIKPD